MQLIDNLLDVSRIVTGKMEMVLGPTNFEKVVRTVVDATSTQVTRKSIRLTLTCDEGHFGVNGNATRLQQVVSNLLTNAIKFTEEGGVIDVSLKREGARLFLRVSDNGRGIEPTFLPHIFRRFSQEDSTVTRTHGGLGLGLAIVHHLVELHGGSTRAESGGAGKGAAFTVSLPLDTGRAGEIEKSNEQRNLPSTNVEDRGESRALNDLRVLVVDDDGETREAVASMLEGTGAKVRVAESAAQGLAVLEDFRPAVVLCDIAMPGEDGYSFIRRMRALGAGRGGGVPALALTALASQADRTRALSAGYQMHVSKPVDGVQLTQAVVTLCHSVPELPQAAIPSPNVLRYRDT
ncbi:MAG TPA: ATP-binding protein [Polyangia bacterium]